MNISGSAWYLERTCRTNPHGLRQITRSLQRMIRRCGLWKITVRQEKDIAIVNQLLSNGWWLKGLDKKRLHTGKGFRDETTFNLELHEVFILGVLPQNVCELFCK